ncbi:hypothetical protein BP6252_10248 [Coleophoma cylindrospora]|uniref:Heterokaryon incompatibility domain-containing protein n=1 Tax=Coleophoma cylindrospora TaxID=1849047 RepID=A0A3D8QS41_9HELO|nr:hypothetical protein BP6252_10248 [Coleophoma cylindrospora]
MDDDSSRELVVSLQIFAKEGMELYDVVQLLVDGTLFDLYTLNNDPAAQYVSSREEKVAKNSLSTSRQIQEWIRTCEAGHSRKSSKCEKFVDTYLPDRCIEIAPKDSLSDPKLVETKGKKGRYIALSYCWGEAQYNPLQTKESNYKQHQEGIPFNSLSLTIQDAIQATRQFGVQYLWVDAICIIQDSNSDKDAQIGQMRAIFENAFITILAATAVNASEGFLAMPKPKPIQFKIPYFCPNGEVGTLYCVKAEHKKLKDQPINRRAWTLEERLLSRRKVIYLSDHVTWECDSVSLADSGDISNMHDDDLRLPDHIRKGVMFATPGWLEWTVHTEWVKNVAWYTKRELTRSGDKLRAIGGIANKYHTVMEDQYLAGLWRSYIPPGLLWRRLVTTDDDVLHHRPVVYRAPSWSWASVDGEIEYDWPERMDGSLECTRLGHKESIARVVEVEVIEAGIRLAKADRPFGAVTGGFIEVSGMVRVIEGLLQPVYHEEKGNLLRLDIEGDLKRLQDVDCWPDTTEVLPKKLWLLALTGAAEDVGDDCVSTFTIFVIRGLILVPDRESGFRRVGFYESKTAYYEVLISGFEKQRIILH